MLNHYRSNTRLSSRAINNGLMVLRTVDHRCSGCFIFLSKKVRAVLAQRQRLQAANCAGPCLQQWSSCPCWGFVEQQEWAPENVMVRAVLITTAKSQRGTGGSIFLMAKSERKCVSTRLFFDFWSPFENAFQNKNTFLSVIVFKAIFGHL